jgi:hypothetical protein
MVLSPMDMRRPVLAARRLDTSPAGRPDFRRLNSARSYAKNVYVTAKDSCGGRVDNSSTSVT